VVESTLESIRLYRAYVTYYVGEDVHGLCSTASTAFVKPRLVDRNSPSNSKTLSSELKSGHRQQPGPKMLTPHPVVVVSAAPTEDDELWWPVNQGKTKPLVKGLLRNSPECLGDAVLIRQNAQEATPSAKLRMGGRGTAARLWGQRCKKVDRTCQYSSYQLC
jgi:hypothetical protein